MHHSILFVLKSVKSETLKSMAQNIFLELSFNFDVLCSIIQKYSADQIDGVSALNEIKKKNTVKHFLSATSASKDVFFSPCDPVIRFEFETPFIQSETEIKTASLVDYVIQENLK
jgi:hypothetical protein